MPMSRADHFLKAGQLLDEADEANRAFQKKGNGFAPVIEVTAHLQHMHLMVAAAQVHATLATVPGEVAFVVGGTI
jgi:hypothetical protein